MTTLCRTCGKIHKKSFDVFGYFLAGLMLLSQVGCFAFFSRLCER